MRFNCVLGRGGDRDCATVYPRGGRYASSGCRWPREDAGGALKTRQVRHRDLGMALAVISGHLRRSDNDLRDS